jgi:hypothetical protein
MNPRLRWIVCLAVLQTGLMGCSLSPIIERSSVEYNTMVANYTDQVLLATILRAKDNLPISMTNLTSITGSFSFTGSVTASRTTSGSNANTWSPTLSGVSSPNWNMTPLSTQGFALSIMQPISPTYVVSKWDSGMDKEFLLLLFVKSITINQQEFRNNPDSPSEMKAFREKIEDLEPATLRMKTLTFLEPVGPDFDPVFGFSGAFSTALCTPNKPQESGGPGSTPGSAPGASGTAPGTAPYSVTYPAPTALAPKLLDALSNVASTGDAQYHYGNDNIHTTSVCSGLPTVTLQLYRQYSGQVTLCSVKHPTMADEELKKIVRDLKTSVGTGTLLSKGDAPMYKAAMADAVASSLPKGPTATPSATPQARSGGNQAPLGGSGQSLANVLQQNRRSAVADSDFCSQAQVVQKPITEEQFEALSKTFVLVNWRSMAEVIQYLGAVARNQSSPDVHWMGSDGNTQSIFRLTTGPALQAAITVEHRNDYYSVAPTSPGDHSLQALSMLSELLGTARSVSDIPLQQTLQVIP